MDAKTIEALEMTKEELDEIRRIWAAASFTPWGYVHIFDGEEVVRSFAAEYSGRVATCYHEHDAAAIAAAPTHIAKLIAEVERLRAAVDDCKECMHDACATASGYNWHRDARQYFVKCPTCNKISSAYSIGLPGFVCCGNNLIGTMGLPSER